MFSEVTNHPNYDAVVAAVRLWFNPATVSPGYRQRSREPRTRALDGFPIGRPLFFEGCRFFAKTNAHHRGGVAGIAAAAALAKDHRVTLFEAGMVWGGAWLVRLCRWLPGCLPHVSLGCCHALRSLYAFGWPRSQPGAQPRIWFHTLDGRVSSFGAGWLPWPLHHAGSFARAHWLSLSDKVAIARAVWWLKTHTPSQDDMPLASGFA